MLHPTRFVTSLTIVFLCLGCGNTSNRQGNKWEIEDSPETNSQKGKKQACKDSKRFECADSCPTNSTEPSQCLDGNWQCPGQLTPVENLRPCETTEPNQKCRVEHNSENIESVDIEFPGRCRWNLVEVRRGIAIPYRIVVDEKLEKVIPEPRNCPHSTHPSGLVVNPPVIKGNDYRFCNCASGSCPATHFPPRTLKPGTYEHTVTWSGRNRPRPTGQGTPNRDVFFPPGEYEVVVSATGKIERSGSVETFRLEERLQIEITDP